MTDDIGTNVKSNATWTRLIYLILYGIIYWFANFVLFAIAIVQFIKTLLSGSPFEQLQAFGSSFAEYNRQLVAYMSYHSDFKPFPVGPWPPETPRPDAPATTDDVIIVAATPEQKPSDSTEPKKPSSPRKKPEAPSEGDGESGASTS
ncbi:DUF4389 domain-containing protein [Sneathiella sp.]|uniref:DUF4389 domain-containing protein n=1 Tax=Sneathiella sp. TaxID=1964365 RepID=UPI002FE0BD90